MVKISPKLFAEPIKSHVAGPEFKPAQKALYIGSSVDELNTLLSKHIGKIDMSYTRRVAEAIELARTNSYDVIIVDQREDELATRLIVPLMASHGKSKLIVISNLKDVSSYLAVPGVARVIAAPLREAQVLRVLGLKAVENNTRADTKPEPETPKPTQRRFNPFAWAMTLVSNLYKRTAFVLLAALFSAFAFYGLLIAFFLLSSKWAAPLTLVRGHELVNKVEAELAQLMVNEDMAAQRMTEAQLAKIDAERTLAESYPIVKGSIKTVELEIKSRTGRIKVLGANLKRLQKTKAAFRSSESEAKQFAKPDELFKKRLIDRKTYDATAVLGLEVAQRADIVQSDIETTAMELENLVSSIEMLRALKSNLEGKVSDDPAAAPPDLLLLAKQAMDARTAIQSSKAKLSSIDETIAVLANSRKVLARQIADIKNSPPGRAIEKRIDVVFVPYTNLANYAPGTKLYSCAFTVILCAPAGEVGATLPGESSYVHPFFGKPIRGVFAEIKLSNPGAAAREIIHAKHKPLFF
jgi:hypothetical protein